MDLFILFSIYYEFDKQRYTIKKDNFILFKRTNDQPKRLLRVEIKKL